MGRRIALLILSVGLVWCIGLVLRRGLPHFRFAETMSIGEQVQAELCRRASNWVGDAERWRFLAEPNRERLSFVLMIKTKDGVETSHFMESDIMGHGPSSAETVGPEYTSKADAQLAFRKLCQRLGRPKPNIPLPPPEPCRTYWYNGCEE